MDRAVRDAQFREFVAGRGAALLRSAFVMTGGDTALAEDLLQQVLAKVVQRWNRIQRRENVEAYVRAALYREYASWWRVARNREQPVSAIPEPQGFHFDQTSVDRLTLDRAIAQLPRRQRAVIVLRFYEDRSIGEAAAILGCSEGTVKSSTHHALSNLRALCADAEIVDEQPTPIRRGGAK